MNKNTTGSNEPQKGPDHAFSEEHVQRFVDWYLDQWGGKGEIKTPLYMEVDLRKEDYDILTIVGMDKILEYLKQKKSTLEKEIEGIDKRLIS